MTGARDEDEETNVTAEDDCSIAVDGAVTGIATVGTEDKLLLEVHMYMNFH